MQEFIQTYHVEVAILVWIFSGGIGNFRAIRYFRRTWKYYYTVAKPNAIAFGEDIPEFEKLLNKENIGTPFFFEKFFGGNFLAFFGSVLWPLGLPIYILILLGYALNGKMEKLEKDGYFSDETNALKWMQKHPSMARYIVKENKKDHKYYKEAVEVVKSLEKPKDDKVVTMNLNGGKHRIRVADDSF